MKKNKFGFSKLRLKKINDNFKGNRNSGNDKEFKGENELKLKLASPR